MIKYILILLIIITIPLSLSAGTTGKIAGMVKDKSTGEPLPMANVQIKGTQMGAASDLKGNYFILSVCPGTYTLSCRMMGYQTVEVKNVIVSLDQTTKINFFTDQEVMDLGESVVIVAERPVIQKDLTTSVEIVGLEDMKKSTVNQVREMVNLQTGVFFDPIAVEGNLAGTGRGEKRYSVRGGEQDEVVWFVDGTRASVATEAKADGGGSFTQINQDAVQEIQVITGGFNAEYGQAQSGIVNIITKEGSPRYTFSIDYEVGPRHQRHFGTYLYDQEKNIEFITHRLDDGTLDPAWWTADRQKQVFDYRDFDDHDVRISFGGPMPGSFIPLIGDELKKMTFFLTGQYQERPYDLPRPRDTRNILNMQLNGKYVLKPDMHIKFGGMYSHDAHATNAEESFPLRAKYYRGYGSLLDNYVYQLRSCLVHTLKPNMFYEVKLSSYTFKQKESLSPYRILGESKKPDVWGWHFYDNFENEPFIAHHFGPLGENVTNDLSLTGHFNWQANQTNLFKSGFEFHYFTCEEEGWILPSFSNDMSDWRNRGLNETYHPVQLGAYVQDKMEFESMILNMGIRYDYFNGNREWFTKDSFVWNPSLDTEYNPAADPNADCIDTLGHAKWSFENVLAKPREKVRAFHSFNPRLGISFPITESTVFHFSYGHFYQIPAINTQFDFLYHRPDRIIKGSPPVGPDYTDPERVIYLTLEPLRPEKTIQFEMGFKHHFEGLAVFNMTAFYKDIFDKVERPGFLDNIIKTVDPWGRTSYLGFSSRFSGDYGDARGIELSMKTLFSNDFVINLNYSFSKSTHGVATPREIQIDANQNITYNWYVEASDRLPTENSFSRPHILRANFFMQYPDKWKLPLLRHIIGNTDMSLLYTYISGQAYTYREADDPPDLLDNKRFPPRTQWDLKLNKYVQFGGHTIILYGRVNNLFNQKNIKAWGHQYPYDGGAMDRFASTGEPTPIDADGYDISYMLYYEPRSYWIGFRYQL